MVQVVNGRLAEVPEFASPPALLHSWLVLVSDVATSAELHAVEHAVSAIGNERGACHAAELAFSWLQQGEAQYALDWFTAMTKDIAEASWHWGQAAVWLDEFGIAERATLYQPLLQDVSTQRQRLAALSGRLQGQVARYCQEWGLTLPLASEEDKGDGYGDGRATD